MNHKILLYIQSTIKSTDSFKMNQKISKTVAQFHLQLAKFIKFINYNAIINSIIVEHS